MNLVFKIIKHVATFLLVVLPAQLLGYILIPIALMFVKRDGPELLPKVFRIFDNARGRLSEGYRTAFSGMPPEVFRTFGNTFWPHSYRHRVANPRHIWDGLSGDTAFRIKVYKESKCKLHPRGFIRRYQWLAFRNPVNYLKHVTLGYQVQENDQMMLQKSVSRRLDWLPEMFSAKKKALMEWDVSDQGCPGVDYREIQSTDGKIFEYYYIRPYMLFGRPKCVRIRIGWKIGDKAHIEFHRQLGLPLQWAFVISPFKSYNPLAPDEEVTNEQ